MIFENLFSRKYKRENGLFSDVYQYDEMPEKLKITLYKIFVRAIDEITDGYNQNEKRIKIYHRIHDILCEEHSLHYLSKKIYYERDYPDSVINFFINTENLIIQMDIVQLFCARIKFKADNSYGEQQDYFNSFIKEINQRMLEHSFGYQFEENTIIRIDTKHTHSELVKPTFTLLKDTRFKNADEEYRDAFEAFKRSDYENVFVECNKAFESTMKIICEINKFTYKQADPSSKLITILKDNDFIKGYNEDMLNGLVKVLSSISTLRNKEGGHGKGVKDEISDISYVNFALHLTASKILFLMERQLEFSN